ncbi:GlxA family transcriptional regulator [Bordetella genomosp. 13]|uniref:AraC family transcriptional regulator n=1 Tax=Bordetella genomosp. 13 TaxID=463040 RepID=A0A1W6ZGP1_9BORD|nr:helix-turn-helix domain-containing protein [Bordetella genomosp. 13]ARP96573.1 AraC family transcriptional regulator [Bordetella genomosp. 13]
MIPVYFVVVRDIVLLDLAGPAEAFRAANKFAPGSFAMHYCGPEPSVESGLAGLHLGGLQPLPRRLPADALVVLSGVVGASPDWNAAAMRALVRWLAERQPADGFTLMSVCAGALVAAAAGLLNGRECTSHHDCLQQLSALEPGARVHDNRIFVEDGAMLTSAGITAGIDLALHLVARTCGPQIAAATARDMVVYLRRAGNDPALSPWLDGRNHLHPGVHKVQDAILRDPAAAWSADLLARQAHTSSRHLNRLFAEHAGCTPMEYVYRIRLALASELIRETRLDLERVAERAGFGSAHHLRRVWRRHAEGSPGALRVG